MPFKSLFLYMADFVVFVDNLGIELYSLSFVGFLTLYMTVKMYLAYKRGEKNLENHLRLGIVPMTVLGIFIFIMGLESEFTWPLPGAYNILFFDPYVMLGVILIAATVSVLLKEKLQNVGFLTLLMGFVLIDYGVQAYSIGLTKEPLALLGLFVAFGVAAIFAYPVTLIMDRMPAMGKRPSAMWTAALVVFWIFLLLASVIAAVIASSAIPAHLVAVP